MVPMHEPPKACRGCGYPMQGLPTDRCPECGSMFPSQNGPDFWDNHRLSDLLLTLLVPFSAGLISVGDQFVLPIGMWIIWESDDSDIRLQTIRAMFLLVCAGVIGAHLWGTRRAHGIAAYLAVLVSTAWCAHTLYLGIGFSSHWLIALVTSVPFVCIAFKVLRRNRDLIFKRTYHVTNH